MWNSIVSIPTHRAAALVRVILILAAVLLAPHGAGADEGDLDLTFGVDGIAHVGVYTAREGPVALAIQADGKVLLAGHDYGIGELFVARFDESGVLDPDFGSGGLVHTGFSSSFENAVDVAVQADGKILLAGFNGLIYQDFVARFLADGAIDPDFGNAGFTTTGFTSPISSGISVAIQDDGKILLAGHESNSLEDFVMRFDGTGVVDPSFGGGGIVYTGFYCPSEGGVALAVQANDGKILLAGHHNTVHEDFVARFEASGVLDAGFGSGGIAFTGFFSTYDSNVALALQPDGKVLLGGHDGSLHENFVARFDASGTLDMSFAGDGVARTGLFSTEASGVGVARQMDGKVVLAGNHDGPFEDFLARFDGTGALDPSFGTAGIAYTGVPSSFLSQVDVAIQADGKILLAGDDWAVLDLFVARFIATGGSSAPRTDDPSNGFALSANCPNPFCAGTTIAYFLPRDGRVSATVADVGGRQITTLVDGVRSWGPHVLQWDATDRNGDEVTSGVYFLRLTFAGAGHMRRMVVTR